MILIVDESSNLIKIVKYSNSTYLKIKTKSINWYSLIIGIRYYLFVYYITVFLLI